ncbi:Phospholipase D1, partial [Elasticomyces elasticus]
MQTQKISLRNQKAKELAKSAKQSARHPQHHTLRLENSERKLRLLARNERQMNQFEDSIRFMVSNTPWSRPNRFDSFAPVRSNCFAQWLVDARDHMWMVSRAINQAKDVIYIHDWWLSPELYMRRPAAISQKWRLDRLLQRKAREGVKIFVIMYRNINSAIPIDSEYSKFSLLDLHPNVFVQRSPNQFRQNTFFWAHHEKLCIIDHTLAFVGGIDLCFGRWDTPQHHLTDDKATGFEAGDTPKDSDHCQLWPGKDYSNPRIQDFYELDKPYEEMYDRNTIPRMPWHDISMHVVGQPARDLTRHFVQRWNYILRQRKPTRPTPFLLPPPDFDPRDLEALGLDGTCEVQILRSSSMWSTGTPDVTEHSIMNAYVKMIEESEHFVYIENQFFVSTCEIDGRKIENLIGDALVERIIRAAKNGEAWRAAVLIPLMPGFQNTVDSEGGTS